MEKTVDKIYNLTKSKFESWKNHNGYAPVEASTKLNRVMLDWIIELTKTLEIWETKGNSMTDGELILACANMGALVESMMKFVLSVYILDYNKEPLFDREGNLIPPEKLKFENLKVYCFDKVWNDNYYEEKYPNIKEWVGSIQRKRNAIHAFNNKEIGRPIDYYNDIENYWMFINMVFNTLPDDPYFEV